MNQKKIIAVIDSGVDRKDLLLKNAKIEDLYYEDGELKEQFTGRLNMHGTEIIKVLLREYPEMRVISIRTLNEDNKCMLSDIIRVIQYCIEINVDIINLSLGSCTATAKKIDILRQVCEEAIEKGIVIFAADPNLPNMKSYPANFERVIGITTSDELKDICHIRYGDRIVEFSDSMVYIPDSTKCTIRRGNSYLCPLIVGLFCNFMGTRNIDEEAVQEFMNFLQCFSHQQNASKIFFDKYKKEENDVLKNKKLLFFADNMDINNMRLYGMYKEICDVKCCFDDIFESESEEIIEYTKTADAFFFGALSNKFINENQAYLDRLISILESQSKMVITVFPIIDTYRRISLTAKKNFQLKSIYK